jgi:hypothetical protein
MAQKQDKSFLPSLDLIILIGVFILAIAFTGVLLPFHKTTVPENQTNTSIPFTDNSNAKTLQLKDVKFNSSIPDTPTQQGETCEETQINEGVVNATN